MKLVLKQISRDVFDAFIDTVNEENNIRALSHGAIFIFIGLPVVFCWFSSYLFYLLFSGKMFKVGDLITNEEGRVFIILSELLFLESIEIREKPIGTANKYCNFFGYRVYDTQEMRELVSVANSLKKMK
jgi:hypothetical protein